MGKASKYIYNYIYLQFIHYLLIYFSEEDDPKNFEKEYSVKNEDNDNMNNSYQNSFKNPSKQYNFKNPMQQTSYEKQNNNSNTGGYTNNYTPYNQNYNSQESSNKKIFLDQNENENIYIKNSNKEKAGKPPMYIGKNKSVNTLNTQMGNGNRDSRNNSSGQGNRNISAEKVEKRMTPYFTKMANQYNPKYRERSNEKFNRIKSEQEIKMREECTFKPKLSEYANKMEKKNEGKDELIKRLATPKIVEIQKRQKEKEAAEANIVRIF